MRPLMILAGAAGLAACTPHGEGLELDDFDDFEQRDSEIADAEDEADEGVVDDEQEPRVKRITNACDAGRRNAEADLRAGRPRMETFGYPADCRELYARELERRFGVELVAVAGCVVDDRILDHARCYNAVVTDWIAAKWGEAALKKLDEDTCG